MTFPDRGQGIIDTLWQQHQDLARGSDEERRALTMLIAEQLRFELGVEWGTKKAADWRPQSKDAVAYLSDPIIAWDWQNGSTREPNRIAGSEGTPLPGQVFIAVAPVNHLDVNVPAPVPSPDPWHPTPVDLAPVLDKLDVAMRRSDQQHQETMDALARLERQAESWGRQILSALPLLGTLFGRNKKPKATTKTPKVKSKKGKR